MLKQLALFLYLKERYVPSKYVPLLQYSVMQQICMEHNSVSFKLLLCMHTHGERTVFISKFAAALLWQQCKQRNLLVCLPFKWSIDVLQDGAILSYFFLEPWFPSLQKGMPSCWEAAFSESHPILLFYRSYGSSNDLFY